MSAPKLSNASKMPCKSWSLQAIDTCPGSIDKSHPSGLVAACRGCYATTGNYRFPNVIAPRVFNRTDWQRDAWVSDMVALLINEDWFRWFDSGDCYSLKLARKILQVMKLTPHCKHWFPTRMHKFAKFLAVFDAMNALDNVVVRFSSDGIHGEQIKGAYTSTIIEDHDSAIPGYSVCEAYSRDGKCGDCRACWDKNVPVIAYPQHGRKMAKINIQLRVA